MASKVDMSLDDLVQLNRRKGPGGGQGKFTRQNQMGGVQKLGGKFQPAQAKIGRGAGGGGGVKKVGDLRDMLAKKQKSTVGDLRTKLKPKALYTSKLSKSQPSTPQGASRTGTGATPTSRRSPHSASNRGQATSPMKPIRVDSPPPPSRPSRRSDPGPVSHKPRSAIPKLPSYDEAKKITVTVPGLRHPPSSSEVSCKFIIPPCTSHHREACIVLLPFTVFVCALKCYTIMVCTHVMCAMVYEVSLIKAHLSTWIFPINAHHFLIHATTLMVTCIQNWHPSMLIEAALP